MVTDMYYDIYKREGVCMGVGGKGWGQTDLFGARVRERTKCFV